MRLCLSVLGLESWTGGDFAGVRDFVAVADAKGIDQVTTVDHVIMGTKTHEYPYGPFRGTPTTPFLEPLVELATYAAVTTSIRLTTGIIISPLRPAVVLAKQVATLDVLSRGRVDIGLGVGWQSDEYRACGVPWDARFDILDEQIRACRALWDEPPVDFHGAHVNIDGLSARPLPPQGKSLPIVLGVALLRRNVERIAQWCDGWLPMEKDPKVLKAEIDKLKRAYEAHGRDPATLEVRASYEILRNAEGRIDVEATLAQTQAYADAGVTTMRIEPRVMCRRPEDYEAFLERVVQMKGVTAR